MGKSKAQGFEYITVRVPSSVKAELSAVIEHMRKDLSFNVSQTQCITKLIHDAYNEMKGNQIGND